eukprot:GHVL01029172.1.p2 GENE.GHVL01029172.1~~GHVL01029172.1.p2  ORF type:complete len:107 (-),score=0.04 GHVL01029172.1:697-1017(-)
MSDFDQLPNEVVFHILCFLRAEDLAKTGCTCRRLHELSNMDSLWEALCRRKYGLTSTEGWGENVTFYDIYSKGILSWLPCELFFKTLLYFPLSCVCFRTLRIDTWI